MALHTQAFLGIYFFFVFASEVKLGRNLSLICGKGKKTRLVSATLSLLDLKRRLSSVSPLASASSKCHNKPENVVVPDSTSTYPDRRSLPGNIHHGRKRSERPCSKSAQQSTRCRTGLCIIPSGLQTLANCCL